VTQAGALALLATALWIWPRTVAVSRLDRVLDAPRTSGSPGSRMTAWELPGWAGSRAAQPLLVLAAGAALAQLWPLPVAAVVVALGRTTCAALVRGRLERAVVREERAAGEGLGILIAELRAGRPADEALAAAGRHCGHQRVGGLLSRLGRSLRLGDRLDGWLDVDERAPPAPDHAMPSVAARGQVRSAGSGQGQPRWQVRLIAGVRLSQRTGCALADVVATVESDLVSCGAQRADLRATAAGHRATVALLAGLPILGLAMGSGIGAEPVRILTSTTIGHVLLVAGVALELLGLGWSSRLTRRALDQG